MADAVLSMVDTNGRINYRQLLDYINTYSLSYFLEAGRHPFLVGRDLYEGRLLSNLAPTQTMRFAMGQSIKDKEQSPKRNNITHAIYMLRKKPYSREMPNVIAIGRSSENDIVIADYVISKNHAQIIIFHDMYFLMDVGSTNGTRVNGQLIQTGIKVKLGMNNVLAFGRLIFVFMAPTDLYQGLKAQE